MDFEFALTENVRNPNVHGLPRAAAAINIL
jgi:hypothetical protein